MIMAGLMLSHGLLWAQQNPTVDKFDNLKLNSSPAFVVLGIEPDNIQRPSTPTQLVAGLQNAIVDGKLQPNVAFEFSPYFLKNPVDKTSKRFDPVALMLDKKNFIGTFYRSLSISAATSPTDQQVFGNLKPGTGIGVGVRALLVDGKPTTLLKKWWDTWLESIFIDRLEAAISNAQVQTIANLNAVIDNTFDDFLKNSLPAQKFNTLSKAELDQFLKDTKAAINKDLLLKANNTDKTVIDTYLQTLQQTYDGKNQASLKAVNEGTNPLVKQGFMLEIAIANSMVFQDNTYEGVAIAKTAFWLTPSYRWDVSKDSRQISLLDVMGVGRYTINNQTAGVDVANYLDAGVKGAFTQNKWSGSLEWVYRYASNLPEGFSKSHTYRLTVGMDYKITDVITFKFNFGSNFDGNTTTYSDPKKMFAVGGLNFGLPNFKTGK